MRGRTYAVWGQVHLCGEIVRGTTGYRAQHAYPHRLYLAHKARRLADGLRDAYSVPVHLANPYKEETHR